jgi:hypothetical protein
MMGLVFAFGHITDLTSYRAPGCLVDNEAAISVCTEGEFASGKVFIS